MSNASEFSIKNGELIKYNGPGGEVVIPVGVTKIGGMAFRASKLTSVIIPEGVTSIGTWAFVGCSYLSRVEIPNTVATIEGGAFEYCEALTSIVIPESTKSVGDGVLNDCKKLRAVISPKPINFKKAGKCNFGLYITGDKPKFYAYSSKNDKDNISDYIKSKRESMYDNGILKGYGIYNYSMPSKLFGAIGRLLYPVRLEKEAYYGYVDLINTNISKLMAVANELKNAEIIRVLLSLDVLSDTALKKLFKFIKESSVTEIRDIMNYELLLS